MAMDGKSRMAIAASLVWMAMATFLILGTHGEAVAKDDVAGPTLDTQTEWMAHPAHSSDDFVSLKQPSQC